LRAAYVKLNLSSYNAWLGQFQDSLIMSAGMALSRANNYLNKTDIKNAF
jgi:hypothetical protein